MRHQKRCRLFCIILSVLIISLISCGLRDNPESVSIGENQEGVVPVAEFYDMRL